MCYHYTPKQTTCKVQKVQNNSTYFAFNAKKARHCRAFAFFI